MHKKLTQTPEKIYGIYPMCFRDGYTDGSICSVCGEVLEPCQVIPALPHTRGGLSAVEPTCSSYGWTEGLACQVCSYIMQPQRRIDKLPHTPETLPAVPPTCTTPGLTEGSVCSVCGEVITAQEEIPVLAHTPGTAVKEFNQEIPALDANGNLIQDERHHPYCYAMVTRCADCGEVLDIQYYDHVNGTETAEVLATADACQRINVSCGDCGKLIRWYITSHQPGTPAEEPDGEGNLIVTIKCIVCSYLLSSKPKE